MVRLTRRQTEPVDVNAVALLMSQQTSIASDLAAMRADLSRALTRVEVLDAAAKSAETVHGDHETRLRALERWRWSIPTVGALGVIATIVGVVEAVHPH